MPLLLAFVNLSTRVCLVVHANREVTMTTPASALQGKEDFTVNVSRNYNRILRNSQKCHTTDKNQLNGRRIIIG